jgi:hypothetical protein
MTAQRHLLVRIENEIGYAERYRALCGASGVTKRDYSVSVLQVTCATCLVKLNWKGKRNAKENRR